MFPFSPGFCISPSRHICSGVMPFDDLIEYIKRQRGEDYQYGFLRLFLPKRLGFRYNNSPGSALYTYVCLAFWYDECDFWTYFRDGVTAVDNDGDIIGIDDYNGRPPNPNIPYGSTKNPCYYYEGLAHSNLSDVPSSVWNGQVYGIWKKCVRPTIGKDYDIIVYDSIGYSRAYSPSVDISDKTYLTISSNYIPQIVLPGTEREIRGTEYGSCNIQFVHLTTGSGREFSNQTLAMDYIQSNWDNLDYIRMHGSVSYAVDKLEHQFSEKEGMILCSRSGHDETTAVGSLITQFSSCCNFDLKVYQESNTRAGWTGDTTYLWNLNNISDNRFEGVLVDYAITPTFTLQKNVPNNPAGDYRRYKSDYGSIGQLTSKDWWYDLVDAYHTQPYVNFPFHRHYEAIYG